MATLQARIEALATAVAAKFNAIAGQLLPAGGTTGQVLVKNSAANYDTGWQTPSGGAGAPGVHCLVKPAAGEYLSGALTALALSTGAAAANRMEFMPFIPAQDVTINELALEVTTLVAGSQMHVGIYADNGRKPDGGALIVGTVAALSGAATGVVAQAIADTTLSSGTLYWLAINYSSTTTVRAIAAGGLLALGTPASGTGMFTNRRVTRAFGALPATAPTGTALTSSVVGWVRMKVAA